jgi:hypothetical protein
MVRASSAGLVMKSMRENGRMEKWMGMGLLIFLFKKVVSKISSFSTLKNFSGIKSNFKDLMAKSCAVSGSKLNKKGLKIENII